MSCAAATIESVKTCTKCGATKPIAAFWSDRTRADGKFPQCRDCHKGRVFDAVANKQRSAAWRAANPERSRANVAAWKRRNPDRVRILVYRRIAAKLAAPGAAYTTPEKIAARMALYGERCYYCSGPFEHVEHRIPLTRGGAHLPANMVPSCKSCNSRKHRRTEREFRLRLAEA
jgi:5-methylcytosine-specific restriction endonuclease McrA